MSSHPACASAAPETTLATPAAAKVATSARLCALCAPAATNAASPARPSAFAASSAALVDPRPTSAVLATKQRFHPTPRIACPAAKCANPSPARRTPDATASKAAPAAATRSKPRRCVAAPETKLGAYIPSMCPAMTNVTEVNEYPRARIASGVGDIRNDIAAYEDAETNTAATKRGRENAIDTASPERGGTLSAASSSALPLCTVVFDALSSPCSAGKATRFGARTTARSVAYARAAQR